MTGGVADPGERIAELERELREARETLDAIRHGEVDAIVVGGASGQFVYTLENADRPYRVLVEQMKEGALTLGEDGLVLYVNRSFGDLTGRSPAELVGTNLFEHVSETEVLAAMLAHGQPDAAEVSLRRSHGEPVPVNMSIVELQVEDGAARMLCSIVTDLSEMRKAEDTLRQAQKMDAVGQLTGGIAHDFNNLLMAIASSLAMLKKRVAFDEQSHRLIENAMQGTRRGAALTQRMLAFARRQDLRPECVDVPALVRGMSELVQRTLGPAWPLELDFAEELRPVLADANQLEMALLNLAVNARDAMPEGGAIKITAEQIAIARKHDLAPGDYICLSVIDSGEGMDADTLARATEPFFTTKGVGKGTGLGLSMIDGLARQLGGAFVLESTPGEGTTARLWLPAAPEDAAECADPGRASAPAASQRGLTILVVDDDALILMNTAAMLEDLGHVVLEANSGPQALEIARRQPDIDLLITDQAMPKMTGTELIEAITRERPGLPIILATGYGELPKGLVSRVLKLSKPFDEHDLEQAIAQVGGMSLHQFFGNHPDG